MFIPSARAYPTPIHPCQWPLCFSAYEMWLHLLRTANRLPHATIPMENLLSSLYFLSYSSLSDFNSVAFSINSDFSSVNLGSWSTFFRASSLLVVLICSDFRLTAFICHTKFTMCQYAIPMLGQKPCFQSSLGRGRGQRPSLGRAWGQKPFF